MSSANGSYTPKYINDAFIIEDDDLPNDSANGIDLEEIPKKTLQTENETMDFDDMLPHIGEFGIYQRILFFLMIPFAFFLAFVYFTQIFITLVPDKHWCRIHALDHLPVEQR